MRLLENFLSNTASAPECEEKQHLTYYIYIYIPLSLSLSFLVPTSIYLSICLRI